jgi:hypothetical protein
MLEKPSWQMSGILTERRELKTRKGDEVWAYSLKLTALGGMFTVTTKNKLLYDQCGEGEVVQVGGTFEQYNGGVQLVLEEIRAVEEKSRPQTKTA